MYMYAGHKDLWILLFNRQNKAVYQIHTYTLNILTLEVDTGGDSFEVVAEVSGVTLHIPPDKSIVDVLIEAGIDIEKSCEQGDLWYMLM